MSNIERVEVHFSIKREGGKKSTTGVISGAKDDVGDISYQDPLPLSGKVDIQFSCTPTLCLMNEHRTIFGQIEFGKISSAACITFNPGEFLNSCETIKGIFRNEILHRGHINTLFAALIKKIAKRMSHNNSNPPLLFHVDAKFFGFHVIHKRSPVYKMLQQGMVNIIVVSLSGVVSIVSPTRQGSHDNDSCIICFDEFSPHDSKLICPCSNAFHRRCLCKWLTRSPSCPLCRSEMTIHLDKSYLDFLVNRR